MKKEALGWLEEGNDIYFSNDPLVAESETLVEEIYKAGAVRVNAVLATPLVSETSTLSITLPRRRKALIATMGEIALLTPRGPIVRESPRRLQVTWGDDRERDSSHQRITVFQKQDLYRVGYVFDSRIPRRSEDGNLQEEIDARAWLQSREILFRDNIHPSLIDILYDKGATKVGSCKWSEHEAIGLTLQLPKDMNQVLEIMIIAALLIPAVESTFKNDHLDLWPAD